MTVFEQYKEWKNARDIETEKIETQQIVSVIQSRGLTVEWNNGYVFRFICGGKKVNICNQTDRIVGEYVNANLTPEQAQMRADIGWVPDDLRALIEIECGYQHICINGKAKNTVGQLCDKLLRKESKCN